MTGIATPPTRLGDRLIAAGHLTTDQLQVALHEQSVRNESLGRLLLQFGFINETTLTDTLAHQQGHAAVRLSDREIPGETLAMIPESLAHRHRLIPLSHHQEQKMLAIAIADCRNLMAIDELRTRLPAGYRLETHLCGENEILRAITQHYGRHGKTDRFVADSALPQDCNTFLEKLLSEALGQNASDIHFEPESAFLRIRYRIDGRLRECRALHASHWPALCVRLKVLAGMNIAESRAPQDGRFSLSLLGRQIDFRAASQPTLHGENIVLRLLDRERGIVPLDRLGLTDTQRRQLDRMIARPEGMILVTGPTGSGKTTTLYSILDHLNDESVNIMTLEDPVEYPIPRIRQTSLNDAVKLDFASGVRSILRQDPDIILIGEIRDSETATMAFRASMTGHQVFATLHSNSAIGTLPRLIDIGLSPELIAGNLVGIIAQRLVRRLCPHCVQSRPTTSRQEALFRHAGLPSSRQIPIAGGCQNCDFQGYQGRLAIMELLRPDPTIDDLIAQRAPHRQLLSHLAAQGFRSLRDDGLERVLRAETTLDELSRIVDLAYPSET